MKRITIEVSEELHQRLTKAAKKSGKLRPTYFLEVLIAGLTALEMFGHERNKQ